MPEESSLMNGTLSRQTEDALVIWVNSFPLTLQISSLEELNDGQAIWQMLRNIDPDIFGGELPTNKQSDFSRQQNLQYIYNHIKECLENRNKSYKAFDENDIKRLAVDGSSSDIAKAGSLDVGRPAKTDLAAQFLKLVLAVMIDSPKLSDLVGTITRLPVQTQEVVGTLMREVAELEPESLGNGGEVHPDGRYDSDQDQSRSNFSPSPDPKMDQVLQLEEQYAKIMAQLEHRNMEYGALERELHALSESLGRAQETNDALNNQIFEKDDQLRRQRLLNNDREQSSVRDLESKISQQEESISSLETELKNSQSNVTELQRESRKLANASEQLQKLQDELVIMKSELERQTRKANTADKYMQKLQASQTVEKERDALRGELEDLRIQLSAANKLRLDNLALQKSNDETSRTLSQIEQEHEELRMTKKQLRINYDSLAHQVDALQERFAQDQETIADLKEKQASAEPHTSPTLNGGLEGELAQTSEHEDQMQVAHTLIAWMRTLTASRKARISELEKERQRLLTDASSKDAETSSLQRQLLNAQGQSADQLAQTQRLRQEILSLEDSLAQVRQGHPIEGTETFNKIRNQLKFEEKKCAELEDELSTARSLVDHPEEVKQTAAALTKLESEHRELQEQHRRLQAEHNKQNASNNAELELIDGELSLDKIKAIIQQASSELAISSVSNIIFTKMEDGRERVAKQQKQLEDQDASIKELEKRLELSKSEAAAREAEAKSKSASAENTAYIQNLERELKLIASTYHDLAGRLQMSNVVLQRKSEAPKSWLGRQRRAMEGPTGLVR